MVAMHTVVGLLLLTLGRRLFWIFVGCLGFAAGLQMAEFSIFHLPFWVAWGVALVFGLIGALLALFYQSFAILLGGFVAGNVIISNFMVSAGFSPVPLMSILGGIGGAILLYALFDWALIGLSSLAGASLIVEDFHLAPQAEFVLFTLFMVGGILFQILLWRKYSPEKRGRCYHK